MTNFLNQQCVPCKGDVPPLTEAQISEFLRETPNWEVIMVEGIPHLQRSFTFEDFAEALAFTNTVGELAETEGHHPLIELTWGKVTIEWWTHSIKGLHMNDFIMAAKTSNAYQN